MKNLLKIFGLSILVMGISSCAGGKDYSLEQNPPFEIESAYFQKWMAGVRGGGSGTKVFITLSETDSEISFVEIHYRNTFLTATKHHQKLNTFYADFLNEGSQDVIMDGETVKESQNIPPPKSPFNLDDNEAVIGYKMNGEMKYYKISNLEEKPIIAYPSTNPNGRN